MKCRQPEISARAYIAPGAVVRGEVSVAEHASVWFNAVVRGDEGAVHIGEYTNIQDCCVLHSDLGLAVEIGAWVTIGHGAVVRGARVGDRVMIGMNATVMSGASIGEGSIVGAASFVPYRAELPPYSMIYGTPARVVRPLTDEERQHHEIGCRIYLRLAEEYRAGRWGAP